MRSLSGHYLMCQQVPMVFSLLFVYLGAVAYISVYTNKFGLILPVILHLSYDAKDQTDATKMLPIFCLIFLFILLFKCTIHTKKICYYTVALPWNLPDGANLARESLLNQ